jgi:hypothetical protein
MLTFQISLALFTKKGKIDKPTHLSRGWILKAFAHSKKGQYEPETSACSASDWQKRVAGADVFSLLQFLHLLLTKLADSTIQLTIAPRNAVAMKDMAETGR